MYHFKLLIEQNHLLDYLMGDFPAITIEQNPHREVQFSVDSIYDLQEVFTAVTKRLDDHQIAYVLTDELMTLI